MLSSFDHCLRHFDYNSRQPSIKLIYEVIRMNTEWISVAVELFNVIKDAIPIIEIDISIVLLVGKKKSK